MDIIELEGKTLVAIKPDDIKQGKKLGSEG